MVPRVTKVAQGSQITSDRPKNCCGYWFLPISLILGLWEPLFVHGLQMGTIGYHWEPMGTFYPQPEKIGPWQDKNEQK